MMLARNLNEFLRAAQREAAGFSYNSDERERADGGKGSGGIYARPESVFDADGATGFQ